MTSATDTVDYIRDERTGLVVAVNFSKDGDPIRKALLDLIAAAESSRSGHIRGASRAAKIALIENADKARQPFYNSNPRRRCSPCFRAGRGPTEKVGDYCHLCGSADELT